MADIMKDLSLGMGKAVKRAAKYTVGVEGRGGYPSSGVIYESGLVLSADHTVEREEEIEILMADGSRQSAKVKGRDPISDLVLLELSEKAGTPAAASEQKAEVGQIALALGRPTEEGIQASLGILSIVNGTYRAGRGIALEGVMRSDALRLPGFVGGPLVDNEGRLLGVNTVGSSSGTSITIPADMAWKIAAKLRSGESIKPGFLGIRSQQVELPEPSTLKRDQATGLLVVGVDAESPIATAGVMVGDILVGFDGRPITDHEDLLEQLMTGMGGKTVSLELLRGGKREEVSVTVGTLDRPLRDRIHRRGWQRGCCP